MQNLAHLFCDKLRSIYYDLCVLFQPEPGHGRNSIRIDVIIPAIDKNLQTLPQCIRGINQCVMHQIANIYIVAPRSEAFIQWCERENLVFVDEVSVLGYPPGKIDFTTVDGRNRSGWIYQQLLKLAGNIGTERYFLVCDADHILIRPHSFITGDGKFIFYQSKYRHRPYFRAIEKLMGKQKKSYLSYVSHKMIFDKELLAVLKHRIEEKCRMPWDQAICSVLDRHCVSTFSEFELYGNFVPEKNKIKQVWRNKNLPNRDIIPYPDLQRIYSGKYMAVTFPGYKQYLL